MSTLIDHWNRLSVRLPVMIALFAALTGLVAGAISYVVAERGLVDIARERMELVRNERARAVTQFVQDARIGLGSLVTRPGLADDIKEFSREFLRLDDVQRSALVASYASNNPFPAGSRSAFNAAEDGSGYSAKHKASHDRLLRLLQIKEMDDIMLIDLHGNVVYSVAKEEDFGTNFLTGPYKDTVAAKVYRKALAVEPPWEQAFADMEVYPPSGHPALFMAQVVNDSAGVPAGVLMFQLNNAKLRESANHIQDLGETGEVYLVGPDSTRRSQSRFARGELLADKVTSQAATRSIAGFSESAEAGDYRGEEVISAYGPIDLMGVRWGIISNISRDEALAPLRPMVISTSSGVLVATMLIALVGYAAARRISRPLEASLRVMDKLSAGDLNVEIADGNGVRETRQISTALRAFHANLSKSFRLQGELERAATEAKSERARAEAILAGAPDPIFLVRSDSTIEYVNPQVERVLGYSANELVGERIERLIPQRFSTGHRSHVRGFFDVGVLRQMGAGKELFAVAKDGREIPVEIGLSPIRVGEKPVVVAQLRDITERKQAAAELRESQQLLSGVIQNSDTVIFVKRKGRYILVNKAWEKMAGISAEEARNKTDLEVFDEESARKIMANDAAIIASGQPSEHEEPVMVNGRRIVYLSVKFPYFNEKGEVDGLCGMSTDITQRADAERMVREARDVAEAATKAKSDFLASMSHEIRTPMNGITGMADLLAQTTLDDEQRHMVRTIRESGNALITVINDILDFSKIEAGKLDLESVTMSVADAVEGVAAMLAPNAAKKGVRIHVFVDPALPEVVHGDPTRVRQILFNLGGNAVKFSNGKDVQIRALRGRTDDVLRFEVIDRGIGISKENQTKLFQAFSQAESSTTRRFGGTGLGLAICRRLTDLMGGTLGVDSREGHGSTFWVELPFPVAEGAATGQKPRDLHGLNVILTAGAAARTEAVESYLRAAGAEVDVVLDAEEAVQEARKAIDANKKIDAVMLDLDLDDTRQRRGVEMLRGAGLGNLHIILLQDYRNRGARIAEKDVVTLDANPLIRYRIISAVAVAAGRASPQIKSEADAIAFGPVKAPTTAEALARGQLILLAEDNLTNQDVIRRQLHLLGYTCEFANNGVEALKAFKTGRYALLLTDCHMPEMDGYELTGAIRELEQGSGKRFPIIAVTANALQGEAERCLAAGMDDYVSKPIAMPAMVAALRKWMPAAAEEIRVSVPAATIESMSSGNGAAVIDERAIKDIFGDDPVTFKEILVSFVGPSQSIITDILAARDRRAASDVKDAAHKLKSSARSIGAAALADLCVALETAGKSGDWAEIDALAPKARDEFARVEAYINGLQKLGT
ncbi:MAG: PAS domain S-box protein [Rhodospirillaceae bacterium]